MEKDAYPCSSVKGRKCLFSKHRGVDIGEALEGVLTQSGVDECLHWQGTCGTNLMPPKYLAGYADETYDLVYWDSWRERW